MPFQPSNGILFAVDDFEAAVAALKARGIPVLMEHETPVCFLAMIECQLLISKFRRLVVGLKHQAIGAAAGVAIHQVWPSGSRTEYSR